MFFKKNNFVHGDLKPENVLVDKDVNAYLGDFGTAMIVRSTTKGKGGDILACTYNYIAPEMLSDNQKYLESDVWQFGGILFYCLFSKAPFWNLKVI